MDSEIIAALVAGAGLVIAAALQRGRTRAPRDELERDLKIAEGLPSESAARKNLTESIEVRVDRLATQALASRDWFGICLALMFLGGFCVLTWILGSAGGWWWFLVVPTGLGTVIMVGILIGELKPKHPDGRGSAHQ